MMETDGGTTAEQLASVLFELEAPGEFGVSGVALELPSYPGMLIKGTTGDIPLPVNDDVAARLKTVARVAPFGKGFDTVVDEKVRKAWEIDGTNISFSHPRWKAAVQALTNRVVLELGCDQRAVVEPILYKALLYETGGHFKCHKDTEKEDNMFATLVIQLPSQCTGGTLSMQLGKERKVALFGQHNGNASYQAHYAAFYADVEHCLEPVTSGHRLSLTYSLCWKTPSIALPNLSSTPIDSLLPILTSWSTVPGRFKGPIGIVLEHEYTDSYFSQGMNILKGRDLEVIKAIQSHNKHLSSDAKLRIVLADIRRNLSEYSTGGGYSHSRYSRYNDNDSDDYDWECNESSEQVEDVYDVEGESTECAFSFDALELIDMANGEIIDKDDGDWWGDAVEEEIEGYTGNAGPNRDTVYKKHVIVIYPVKFEFDQVLSCSGLESGAKSLLSSIKRLQDEPSFDVDHTEEKARYLSQWETLVTRWVPDNNKNLTSDLIIEMTMRWKRADLALRFLELLEKTKRNKANFNPPLNLIGLIRCFEWSSLGERLRSLIPLLLDSYSIAAALLEADLLAKDDSLVATLCASWPQSIMAKKCAQDAWSFFSALGDNQRHRDMAIQLRDNKAFHPYVCSLLKDKVHNHDQGQTALVQILFDAFLNDESSLLYTENPTTITMYSTPPRQSNCPMWILAWSFFKRTNDDTRQRVLAQTFIRAFTFERLRDFIKLCIETPPIDNTSNMGIVLLHWLKTFQQRGPPVFSWTLPHNISGHPQVQAFLRDPHQQSFTYQNFNDIRHARNWAAKHFGSSRGSNTGKSIETQCAGSGHRAHVILEKTADHHNSIKAAYKTHRVLFKEWNNRLVQPLPSALSTSTKQASATGAPAPKRARTEVIVID